MKDLLLINRNKFLGGEHKVNVLKQQSLGINLVVFFKYVFKMSVSIAFHCENAVEAKIQTIHRWYTTPPRMARISGLKS